MKINLIIRFYLCSDFPLALSLSLIPYTLKMFSNKQISLTLRLVFYFVYLTYSSEQNKSKVSPKQPVAAMVQGTEG